MWTKTRQCLKRASGYQNRVMVYAHRRQRARYLPPKTPYVRSPLANKTPDHYHETWDPHSGIEWYNRLRHRGAYRHWPWAKWSDDPIRFHEDPTCRRTLSALNGCLPYGEEDREGNVAPQTSGPLVNGPAHLNAGSPLWDYYSEVGEAYHGITANSPLEALTQVIHPYVRHIWPKDVVRQFLLTIERGAKLSVKTIGDVLTGESALLDWASKGGIIPTEKEVKPSENDTRGNTLRTLSEKVVNTSVRECALREKEKHIQFIPKGFIQHLILASRDVVLYNHKLKHREQEHNAQGVLRTREMERYYALPHPTITLVSEHTTGVPSERMLHNTTKEGTQGDRKTPVLAWKVSPAMPERLAQPSGKYPWGKYTYMGKGLDEEDKVRLDPLHTPDAWYKNNQYPG